MKQSIKNFYSSNFVFNGKEKLSKMSIFFIIILDIFIFITLGLGIEFQVNVLTNPSVSYPHKCRTIIQSKKMDDFNKYYYSVDSLSKKYQNIIDDQMDIRCQTIEEKLDLVKKENDIKLIKEKYSKITDKEYKVRNELDYLRENYNTVLFEKISAQDKDKSIIKDDISHANIKEKYNSYKKQHEELKKAKEELYKSFKETQSVKDFVSYSKANKEQILNDYKDDRKAYSIKEALVTLAFLLPILFIAFYLMKKYVQREKYILYVIFKNIFIVTLIPTLISFFSLIYILLPKVFLEKVLTFFYELEIPFLVYYFMIALFVVVFAYIIVKIQNKSSKAKNNSISRTDAYNKSLCTSCGNKVNYETMNYCPCCKNKIRENCNTCGKATFVDLNYCIHCSSDIKKSNSLQS